MYHVLDTGSVLEVCNRKVDLYGYYSLIEPFYFQPRYTANLPDKLQFGMPMRLVIDLTLTVEVVSL